MAPKAEDDFVNGYDVPSPKTVAEVGFQLILSLQAFSVISLRKVVTVPLKL